MLTFACSCTLLAKSPTQHWKHTTTKRHTEEAYTKGNQVKWNQVEKQMTRIVEPLSYLSIVCVCLPVPYEVWRPQPTFWDSRTQHWVSSWYEWALMASLFKEFGHHHYTNPLYKDTQTPYTAFGKYSDPLTFFHILLQPYSKMDKQNISSSIYTQYPIMTKWKQVFKIVCTFIKKIETEIPYLHKYSDLFLWDWKCRCFFNLIWFHLW